jgi:hypothetical protein
LIVSAVVLVSCFAVLARGHKGTSSPRKGLDLLCGALMKEMFNALDAFGALQMRVQKRSSPNMKSSATVTRVEISS